MTRIYSPYAIQDEAPDDFDTAERDLWIDIVQHLERFEP